MVVEAEELIAAHYSDAAVAQMRDFEGVIHVVAVWAGREEPGADLPVILIRADSPRSVRDRFALELARARADAILITGKIVREEPGLRYDEAGAGTPWHVPLMRWRREVLAKPDPPLLVVLSSGRGLDPEHGVFRSWARPLILTSSAQESALRAKFAASEAGRGVEVLAHPEPSVEAVLELARGRGCATIVLEAGPTTLAPLYRGGGTRVVDELLLSSFHGPLASSLRGPGLLSRQQLEAGFERSSGRAFEESSGAWELTRWRRARASVGS